MTDYTRKEILAPIINTTIRHFTPYILSTTREAWMIHSTPAGPHAITPPTRQDFCTHYYYFGSSWWHVIIIMENDDRDIFESRKMLQRGLKCYFEMPWKRDFDLHREQALRLYAYHGAAPASSQQSILNAPHRVAIVSCARSSLMRLGAFSMIYRGDYWPQADGSLAALLLPRRQATHTKAN